MPEASAEIEDEREGLSRISLLGDTCTADPCIRRVTGGEKQGSEIDVLLFTILNSITSYYYYANMSFCL